MTFSLRELKLDDINQLAKIMKNAFIQEPWKEEWKESDCYKRLEIFYNIPSFLGYTLIDENNKIYGVSLGYIAPLASKQEYTLLEIFVDSNYKENHLGTILMNNLLEKLNETNIDIIHFYTSGNLYKFYSKFGFEKSNNEYIMYKDIK